jgi:hypothetical protein
MRILAIALVFGMTLTGCDDGTTTDTALNGTWSGSADMGSGANASISIKFDNGKFEVTANGTPYEKGTYTTSNNSSITMTATDVYGSSFFTGLESRWYTKAQLKAAIREYIRNQHYEYYGNYPSESDLDTYMETRVSFFDSMFESQTGTYSISGTTLTITTTYEGEDGTYTQTITLTKN